MRRPSPDRGPVSHYHHYHGNVHMEQVPWNIGEPYFESVQISTAGVGGGGGGDPPDDRRDPHRRRTPPRDHKQQGGSRRNDPHDVNLENGHVPPDRGDSSGPP